MPCKETVSLTPTQACMGTVMRQGTVRSSTRAFHGLRLRRLDAQALSVAIATDGTAMQHSANFCVAQCDHMYTTTYTA